MWGEQTHKKWELGGLGPWRVGGLKGWPRGQGAQNSRLFFPSPTANFVLSSLSGGLIMELWPRFKAVAHPKCAFALLRGHFVRVPASCNGSLM